MAKHVSEVEDGFAYKKQRDDARKNGKKKANGKKPKVEGECTIPRRL